MAVMGLKINSPSDNFAVKTSLGADFAKALFGDPEMEIKLRRLQSDLVNDEYYRRAQEAATALNAAKTADQEWRTGQAQGAVGPAGQYLQDAMGNPIDTAPAPVELPQETSAIPAPRMSDMPAVVEPTTALNVKQTPEEPFAAIPPVSEPSPPIAFDRVADTPVLQNAPTEPFQPVDPITLPMFAQAPEDPFAGIAPVQVAEPDVSFDTVPRGPDGINLGQLAQAQRSLPGPVSTEGELADWWRNRPGPEVTHTVIPGRETPMRDRPPPPSLQDTLIGTQEITDRPPPPSLEPVPVDMETIGDRPPPPSLEPVPVAGTDRPPPPSLEQRALPTGQAMTDRPPPVDPNYVPPAMAAAPTATGDVVAQPEEIGVIHNKAGQPIARLDADATRALAGAIIANGGDIAGGLNKLAGGLGMTYGDIADVDKMRINYALTGGNLTTTTQITSADKVATQHAIDVAKADPKSGFQTDAAGGDRQIVKNADGTISIVPATGPGALKPAPIIHDVSKGETPLVITQGADNKPIASPLEGAPVVAPENKLGGSDNEQAVVLTDLAKALDDPNFVPTRDQARAYALVHSKMSVPHDDIRQVDDPERPGSKMTVRIPVPAIDLSYLPSKEEVLSRAGLVVKPSDTAPPQAQPDPAQAPVSPATAAAPEVVSPPTAAATELAPAPAPIPKQPFDPKNPRPEDGPAVGKQKDGKIYGTGGYEIVVPSSPAARSEFDKRSWMWLMDAANADKMMRTVKAPPWYRDWAAHTTSGTASPDLWSKFINYYGTDNATKQFLSQSSSFINSEGRINSGAAIQPFENVELGWRYIPTDGDDATTEMMKADNRKVSMDGIYDVLALDGKMTPEMIGYLKDSFGYERNAPLPSVAAQQPKVLRPNGRGALQ